MPSPVPLSSTCTCSTGQEGDAVVCGQVLACSGAVGFCPEPPVHFQLESQAVSLPCSFVASSFTPVSGRFYDAEGAISD
ncbi:hypothetical protein DIPPA_27043 [Diplonema papillatum]|nr:hypothetical protein DIPPA_27043 [Diplonema papillatum]